MLITSSRNDIISQRSFKLELISFLALISNVFGCGYTDSSFMFIVGVLCLFKTLFTVLFKNLVSAAVESTTMAATVEADPSQISLAVESINPELTSEKSETPPTKGDIKESNWILCTVRRTLRVMYSWLHGSMAQPQNFTNNNEKDLFTLCE